MDEKTRLRTLLREVQPDASAPPLVPDELHDQLRDENARLRKALWLLRAQITFALVFNDVEKVRRVLGEALADIARALDGKDLVEPGNDPRLIP